MDVTKWTQEHFVILLLVNSLFADDFILFLFSFYTVCLYFFGIRVVYLTITHIRDDDIRETFHCD